MPHLIVYASESDLAGREAEVIAALTDAVADVYGEWARDIAVVQMIGLPAHRWGVGGRPAATPSPHVSFGIREIAFARPDADEFVARLVARVTEALVAVFGERVRADATVELLATPEGRSSVGGVVVAAT